MCGMILIKFIIFFSLVNLNIDYDLKLVGYVK